MAEKETLTLFDRHGVPNTVFPCEPRFDIPYLRMDKQADFIDLPVIAWGSVSRNKRIVGTVSFYVDDYRFNNLLKNPNQLVQTECVAAFEMNITLTLATPRALVLEKIYRKRWLSRYWQEHNIQIFADVWVPNEYFELCMLGVPNGWKAFCTRAKAGHLDELDESYYLCSQIRGSRDLLFVVYGGGLEVKEHCAERGYTYITEHRDIVKGRFSDSYSNNPYVRVNRLSKGKIIQSVGGQDVIR